MHLNAETEISNGSERQYISLESRKHKWLRHSGGGGD